jgi:transcriptional regulator with XRE-family HTH domain
MEPVREPVNSIDRHIGRRIRIRRQLLRMSSAEAAARLGVREAVFAEHEVGLLRLDALALIRLSGVLGVRLRYFYDGLLASDEAAPVVRRVND